MDFQELKLKQYAALIEDENDEIALLANTSAFLYEILEDVNWVGFYFVRENELVLGPFQGKTACYRIPFSKGVCGWAARNEKAIIVPNFHEFEGHIACDANSKSEIVLPIFKDGKLYAVLDVDSAELDNFCILEQVFLGEILENITEKMEINEKKEKKS